MSTLLIFAELDNPTSATNLHVATDGKLLSLNDIIYIPTSKPCVLNGLVQH